MDKPVFLLPALSCAAMMAVMMWMMRGGGKHRSPSGETSEEIARLRAEVALLRRAMPQQELAQRDADQTTSTP